MIHEHFLSSGATIRGRAHTLRGRNNQDAFVHWVDRDLAVGIVCDGCGSSPASEVGAQICSQLVAQQVRDLVLGKTSPLADGFVDALSDAVSNRLARTIESLGLPREPCIHTWFLTTILGFVISPATALVFAAGDGLVRVDDELHRIGPYPDNAPPYLAYRLLGQDVGFELICRRPTATVTSIVLASDGAEGLCPQTQDLEHIAATPRFVEHPDALRRYLYRTANGSDTRYGSHLHDDTTVVLARRREVG